jgi:Anaerobic dehydrogenases, typically selenocysteine-containing
MKNAVKAGKKLILLDPRRTTLSRHATYNLQFRPDTDVALLNSLMHVIIEKNYATKNTSQNTLLISKN